MFGIVAEFPLGKYVGHVEGQTESVPAPARVLSALLCAAAQGPSAVEVDGLLQPSPVDLRALEWLEANPPTGVAIPESARTRSQEIAYRDMGLLKQKKQGTKVARKPPVRGVTVGGTVGWAWEDAPPLEVQDRLEALCSDVAYLGSSESPVRMRVAEVEPTHRMDPSATLFDPGGLTFAVAATGRLEALRAEYAARYGKVPTAAADKAKTDEIDLVSAWATDGLVTAKYREFDPAPQHHVAPWERLILLEISPAGRAYAKPRLRQRDYVAWCVALHRALVSVIGFGARPMITGQGNAERTSNHLAFQILDASPPMTYAPATEQMFAVMIPHDATLDDIDQLIGGLERINILRRRGSREELSLRIASPVLDARSFWQPPQPGLTRVWRTVPVSVPDSRPIRSGGWSWADTVQLSVAMAWRDFLTVSGAPPLRDGVRRGDVRYVKLAEAAASHGVDVVSVSPVTQESPDRFVHRIAQGTVLRPYVAMLTLGDLAANTALAAIGQSRHLGTGLLAPVDVPQSVIESLRLS